MVVMEITADLEGLQASISQQKNEAESSEMLEEATADLKQEDIRPDQAESSTLRTVIAAWLQTGNLHKMIGDLSGSKYIIANYYWRHAFFNQKEAREQRNTAFSIRFRTTWVIYCHASLLVVSTKSTIGWTAYNWSC
jgi:hypothetical protein